MVWTGHGSESVAMFPPLATLKPSEFPTENACSCALRLEYGDFRYYIGGDLTSDTNFGAEPVDGRGDGGCQGRRAR